jgi:tape measure domain-containing protein
MAGIYFDARINGEQLQRDIADINKQLKNLTTDVEKTGRGIDSTFKNLGGLLAGYFTFNFAGNMVKQIAQVRGEFQQLEVAFETMIGNKARADALMADVVRMASTTPFELKEVASGAKSLLAFGIATEDIIPTLKSLGDVSAGLSVPMERLILNFGQIKTQSKLTGKELRDFNVAGVPIIAELAKNLGKSEQAIQEMVSAGNIGFQEVADAFKSMSSEGGRFADLMDKQAKTIIGLQSNLRDAIDQMFNSIGQSQEGAISSVLKTAISLVENYEKVIDILKILVVTYGAYKAALMTVAAWQAISTKYAVMDIATKKLQIGATLKAAAAQSTLNTAMKLNPYVLAAAAIAGFVTILTTSIKKKREAAQAAAEFADSLETETYNVNKAFEAIKNTTEGTNERAKAIQAVNTQYGTYLPAMLTEASTLDQVAEAQRNVTKAIIDTIGARNKEAMLKPLTESVERTATTYAERVNKALEKVIGGVAKGEVRGQLQNLLDDTIQRALIQGGDVDTAAVKRRIEYIFEAYGNGVELSQWQLANLVGSINNVATANENLRVGTNHLNETTKAYLRTLGLTDEQIGTTSEQISKTVSQQIADTTKAISDAQAELNRLRQPTSVATEEQIKAQEDVIKDLRGKLETLTGISRKAAGEQLKIEEERLKAQKELSDKILELESQTQAAKIAIMEDGTRKQIAEINYQLRQDIQSIERQRRELLAAAKGSTDYDTQAKVINTNSDALLTAVQAKAAQERVKIEAEAAAKVRELWRVVTDEFSSDRERELNSVREYYAARIAEAQKAADKELEINLRSAQDYAEQKVNQQYYADVLEAEADLMREKMKLRQDDYSSSESYQKAEYNMIVKWAQKQIAYYTKLGSKEFEGTIKALVDFMKNLDKTTGEGAGKVQKIEQAFRGVTGIVGTMNKELGDSLDAMGDILVSASMFATALSGDKKDVLGAVTSGIGMIAGFMDMLAGGLNDAKKTKEELSNILDLINSINSAKSNMDSKNWFRFTKMQMDELDKKISDFAKRHDEYGLVGLFGITEMSSVLDYYAKLAELQGSLTKSQQEALDGFIEWSNQYNDLLDQRSEKLLGFSKNDIANSIMQGLEAGKSATEVFAENFGDVLKTAVRQALMTSFLEGESMKAFYDMFYASMEDGTLTEQERSVLKESYQNLIYSAQAAAEFFKQATGVDIFEQTPTTKDQNKITGAIKGITEDTAGIIAGQFYAMRENLLAIREYAKQLAGNLPPSLDDNMNMNGSIIAMTAEVKGIRDLIPLDLVYSFTTIRDNAIRTTDTLAVMNTTQQQMADTALNQLASINETVGHLASIDKKVTDIAKLNSIDARLEELNRNIKNL